MDDVTVAGHQQPKRTASRDKAVERISAFAQRFGEAHLALACHAAFPLALTPDLLYYIWASFVPRAPWTAVADVLLSPLCREVGHELYEMDLVVRDLLLEELKADERLGQRCLNDLADSLMNYVAQQIHSNDLYVYNLAQSQRWTALAYTRPDQAARDIAQTLSHWLNQRYKGHEPNASAELFRLASLVETLAKPLSGFEPLLVYARSIRHSSLRNADVELGTSTDYGEQRQVTGAVLSIPTRVSVRLTTTELARACAKSAAQFHVMENQQDPCYELFCRAAASPSDDAAWEAIFNQYSRLVTHWLGEYAGEDSIQETFVRLWQSLRQSADLSSHFPNIQAIMSYFKRCAISTRIDSFRKAEYQEFALEALGTASSMEMTLAHAQVEQTIDYQLLRELILSKLRNEKERVVFELTYDLGLSPREIQSKRPALFPNVQTIYHVKRNFLSRLQHDVELREFLRI